MAWRRHRARRTTCRGFPFRTLRPPAPVDILAPKNVIGRNTVTNIQAGLTYGYADMVDGLVVRIAEEMNQNPLVVATGGLARIIASVARRIDLVDPLLTLKGLLAIYERNIGKCA